MPDLPGSVPDPSQLLSVAAAHEHDVTLRPVVAEGALPGLTDPFERSVVEWPRGGLLSRSGSRHLVQTPATASRRGIHVKTIHGLQGLVEAEGTDLGASDWVEISQERIDQFADATDDHQWIHVDPERAKSGPFGTTIAHGYLTLSLLPALMSRLYKVEDVSMTINYGLDKVRFVAPVPVGSRVRAAVTLASVKQLDGAAQATFESTIEIEGSDKPAAVATFIGRVVA